MPGAVDTEKFTPRADWRAGELTDANEPKILYHGRIDRRKGALDLIEAFAQLLADVKVKPQLLISGIGPDSETAGRKIAELNLQNNVKLLGYVEYENVPQVYRRADVFASPTYAEGFSNTILEAMASGLAIVSTNAVGVVDCLRNGENGLLVEPGNIGQLKNALKEILTNADLRKNLAANALRECREIYSWRAIGKQIIEVYDQARTEKPDNDWTVSGEIAACRYRETPHLL